jgi:hypothetical protein
MKWILERFGDLFRGFLAEVSLVFLFLGDFFFFPLEGEPGGFLSVGGEVLLEFCFNFETMVSREGFLFLEEDAFLELGTGMMLCCLLEQIKFIMFSEQQLRKVMQVFPSGKK